MRQIDFIILQILKGKKMSISETHREIEKNGIETGYATILLALRRLEKQGKVRSSEKKFKNRSVLQKVYELKK